jgi:hypothetical protein
MEDEYKYYLEVELGGQKIEKEVTLKEYCSAERSAGFRPKMSSDHPDYMTTPATGGFGGSGISGRMRWMNAPKVAKPIATIQLVEAIDIDSCADDCVEIRKYKRLLSLSDSVITNLLETLSDIAEATRSPSVEKMHETAVSFANEIKQLQDNEL